MYNDGEVNKMTINHMLRSRFKHNQSIRRVLNKNTDFGFLGCGFVMKNTHWGSHKNFNTKHYHVVWVLSGTGYYSDDTHKRIEIKTGDVIQRFPGKKHDSIVTSDDWMEIFITLGKPLYDILLKMNVLTQHHPVMSPGLDFKLFETVLAYFDNLNNYGPHELQLLVPDSIEIVTMFHYLDKKNQNTSEEIVVLELSRRYIQNNSHLRPTVEDVASHVNLGYEKFRKMFTEYFGVAPGYYIQQHRIHRAQTMLGSSDISIKEVSMELGYTDTFTFSKRFKKLTGLTPSEFRKIYLA